jgi:hypothetical protein
MDKSLNFLTDNWKTISAIVTLLYELLVRLYPTDKNRSILDFSYKVISLLIPNRATTSTYIGKDKSLIDETKNHVVKIIVLLMMISCSSFGQLNVTAKAYRSYNADSLTVRTQITGLQLMYKQVGCIYYNTQSYKWRVYQDSVWYDLLQKGSSFTLANGNATTANGNKVDLGGSQSGNVLINPNGHTFKVQQIGTKLSVDPVAKELVLESDGSGTAYGKATVGTNYATLEAVSGTTGADNQTGFSLLPTNINTSVHNITGDFGSNIGASNATWAVTSTGKTNQISIDNSGGLGLYSSGTTDEINMLATNGSGTSSSIDISHTAITADGAKFEITGTAATVPTAASVTTKTYVLGTKTFTGGKQTFFTSTTGSAGINIPNGVAPTSPVNGDLWGATNHLFTRLNGVTYQLDQQGGTTPPAGLNEQIQFNNSGSFGANKRLLWYDSIAHGNYALHVNGYDAIFGKYNTDITGQSIFISNVTIGQSSLSPVQLKFTGATADIFNNNASGYIALTAANTVNIGSNTTPKIVLQSNGATGSKSLIIMTNLPTSSSGLPSGALWSNAGILSIVP